LFHTCISENPIYLQTTGIVPSRNGFNFLSEITSTYIVNDEKFTLYDQRPANDFETSWDDWKPDSTEDPVMNACVVPEGTYEVCSRTITKQVSGTAVWETIFFKHSPKWRVD
jgi:hypothetical protein